MSENLPTLQQDISEEIVGYVPAPERPINTDSQDYLQRGTFVNRLSKILVTGNGKSTGVVAGLTGTWGSGKTSILNLLERDLIKRWPSTCVVRFDPWLIEGTTGDLLAAFFVELRSAIQSNERGVRRMSTQAKNLVRAVTRYGAELSVLADVASAGSGVIIRSGTKVAEKYLEKSESLTGLKQRLGRAIKEFGFPIVVLIDELDRVDDEEVKLIAKLVRAIVDFPDVSFLLAYDVERVAAALGDGDPSRGHSYLEKVVQFQIFLPSNFQAEIKDLLFSELKSVSLTCALPGEWDSDLRFEELESIICSDANLIATPRDVKRVVGAFAILRSATQGEVSWVDVLGFSTIWSKFPFVVEAIRRDYQRFVDDPVSAGSQLALSEEDEEKLEDEFERIGARPENRSLRELLQFLFPALQPFQTDVSQGLDRIRYRRPLQTVLRLGLPPGELSRREVESALTSAPAEVAARLEQLYAEGRLDGFLGRLREFVVSEPRDVKESVWEGAAIFIRDHKLCLHQDLVALQEAIAEIGGLLMDWSETFVLVMKGRR